MISSEMGWRMAQSKWKNKITISIGEDKGRIDFKEHPTGFQLMTAYIILGETIDFHFTGPERAQLALQVYERIQNVEEEHLI